MSIETNKRVITGFFTALSSGDGPGAIKLLHKDVAWTIIGDTPVSKTFDGARAFEHELMGEVVKKINPDVGIKMDIIELIAEGDKVVARVKGSVEGKYGPYNNTYCHVFTVRDGLIVENFEHMDTVLVERALYGRKLIETETH